MKKILILSILFLLASCQERASQKPDLSTDTHVVVAVYKGNKVVVSGVPNSLGKYLMHGDRIAVKQEGSTIKYEPTSPEVGIVQTIVQGDANPPYAGGAFLIELRRGELTYFELNEEIVIVGDQPPIGGHWAFEDHTWIFYQDTIK